MNIFYLDPDPVQAAQMHCNKRLVKMVLETAQILCNARRFHGDWPPHRSTHVRHPCSLWAGRSLQNYEWLCELGLALAAEYTRRYGRTHKSEAVIRDCLENPPSIPAEGFTPPPQCMPERYRGPDTVEAYRRYWLAEKMHNAVWPEESRPIWTRK